MTNNKSKLLKTIGVVLLVIALLIIGTSFYLNLVNSIRGDETTLIYNINGTDIAGSLYTPKNKSSYPLVIFLHGDGPSDRSANGGYTHLFNAFLDQGIACFSYDKQGIGDSAGSWYNQTMYDRALEAATLKNQLLKDYSFGKVGFVGLSQGGWVLSEIAQVDSKYDFMINIGGAIDWMRQGYYYERNRPEYLTMSETERKKHSEINRVYDDFLLNDDYEAYLDYFLKDKGNTSSDLPLDQDRFHFIHLNMLSNAEDGIYHIDKPFLGVWGEKDLNVDALESYNTYKEIFSQTGHINQAELIIVPEANHALLKAKYEHFRDNDILQLEMLFLGEGIYADGILDQIGKWVLALE